MITRRTLTAPGLPRWAFAMLAVPALLIGMLAMHFLTGLTGPGAPAHEMTAPVAMTSAVHTMDGSGAAVLAEDCSTPCAPAHEMTAMACLMLALLFAFVLLSPSLSGRMGWWVPRAMLARITVALAALAPPRPPSVTVLSISRT